MPQKYTYGVFDILFSQNEFQWEYLFKQAFRTKNNTNTLFYAIVHYVGVTTNPKYILINVTLDCHACLLMIANFSASQEKANNNVFIYYYFFKTA